MHTLAVNAVLRSPDLLLTVASFQPGFHLDTLPLLAAGAHIPCFHTAWDFLPWPEIAQRVRPFYSRLVRCHALPRGAAHLISLLHVHKAMRARVFCAAVLFGNLPLLSALYDAATPFALGFPRSFVTNMAAANGHLSTLCFLADRGHPVTSETVDTAATEGHLHVLEWLHAHHHPTVTPTEYAMTGAAMHGHVLVLAFLHAMCPFGWTTHAMDNAAGNGHLDAVQFLHEKRREGCTTHAMDDAAWNGHVEVVQFLHVNRTEGCTVNAMDRAATHGHLGVVQLLHCHRSEGCTAKALDGAATNGHLDVVEWLVAHRTEGQLGTALQYATRNRHMKVAYFLDQQLASNNNHQVEIDQLFERSIETVQLS
ncbi:Aste57867_22431 [Aphanomyces stellatus]|uniref:Aste57867_22431 protein n=1 Tax=Aphanomyces stellatus TaxID=120398 RepID=A0A485LKT2_9STRA|nr:hypothetical protein As57867_022361 [Aphanomyces stellatus]VFT99093.1 Aste57867_22431 [Aphanomyces stellatus]